METRRLQILLELSRRGSMRAVSDHLDISTSTVSQQIAALAREVGTALVEPAGRRVRMTPAGRRLAHHAVSILAAVEVAHADLDPDAEPAGTVRVSGFATAVRRTVLPVVTELAASHPSVRVVISEHEPGEALDLLAVDAVDVALVYDYSLAPVIFDGTVESVPLWTTAWGLGVPTAAAHADAWNAVSVFKEFRDDDWIGNSRNRADEHVIRTIAAMAGFVPTITHRSDSLELVEEMILAGLGIGLLPVNRCLRPGIALMPLADPDVTWRAYVAYRRDREHWPPLGLVLDRLTRRSSVRRRADQRLG